MSLKSSIFSYVRISYRFYQFVTTRHTTDFYIINLKITNRNSSCMYVSPAGGTPYNGLYGEAPPERGTFFRLQVYEKGRDFTS